MEDKLIDLQAQQLVLDAIRELGCDAAGILPEHRLCEDLGIDSSETVELAMILRSRLGGRGSALSLKGAATVLEITQRVQALLGAMQ